MSKCPHPFILWFVTLFHTPVTSSQFTCNFSNLLVTFSIQAKGCLLEQAKGKPINIKTKKVELNAYLHKQMENKPNENPINLKTEKPKLNANIHAHLYTPKEFKWYSLILINLTKSSYLICTLLIDVLRFPIIVEIRELSHEFLGNGCKTISCQSCYINCINTHTSFYFLDTTLSKILQLVNYT